MNRLLALSVALWASMTIAAAAQEQPQQQPAVPPVEATKHVVVTWTLGPQEWDFSDVMTTYVPVSGVLDTNKPPAAEGAPADNSAGRAIWTVEIARNLLEGEVKVHTEAEGSPFKAVLLDADKVALGADLRIVFTKITGKKGDKLKVICVLPPEEVFKLTKFIRIERRTKVGFETPTVIGGDRR
ncbi:MAG TPA: hypothetical protein VFB80_19150 [Pirellulaceae bacterium]|nr:hypothetical protein [Pirellulaceae bacterium]